MNINMAIECKALLEAWVKDLNDPNVPCSIPLFKETIDMIESLNNLITKENNKLIGKTNVDKVIRTIIKRAKKSINSKLHGAWEYEGKKYVCDSCTLLEFPKEIEAEDIPSNVKPIENITRLFPDYPDHTITLPSLSELKNKLKERKACNKAKGMKFSEYLYCAEEKYYYNIKYIMEGIEATNDLSPKTKNNKSPLLFEGNDCRMIILPINPNSIKQNISSGEVVGV